MATANDTTAFNDLDLSDLHTQQPNLEGRRAIITGGTTGIGRAIAVLLASEGVRVFTCGRDEQHLADALARINQVGQGDGISADLSNPQDLRRFFTSADAWLGGLDIAVINAAVPAQSASDGTEQDLRYQLETDFVSYIISAREAAARMKAGGDIVLIGSMSAVSLAGGSSAYTAAKSGIQGFATGFRKELADKDIKVGLIEPGFTGADFQYPDYPPERQREEINAERMLRAEDIASATHFMLTQPRRTAVSLIRVEPRLQDE
ncbi:NAD(P)-dependent dehydrogenase (short-subunit alcohol dehydrogenase family) [Novosphingobium hassiacum]|uniref:NAD(P)-dependent dehydrogenase (Short-subunit alcohol dehydrogenase family) n=1 Tax=Novosphingobium hassiacum TaxID=173676 RepID=A0A7W6EV89_9SPHN|nr:SDR family oxidoreductase [Novosphingobium hassiacum]MBB3860012.1 NAD(P)-dependent dehydrogenase (short-subunit alcohol dehydrogenase family) [Novosphingobium hassiacum]